ncbi:hypothetical protein [Rhodococcus sp. OK519]|uniref:hypothetical protein n=1 Tax=Rhodococcus sp. OK519 TaxID=2135729 RepID=UPI002158D90E
MTAALRCAVVGATLAVVAGASDVVAAGAFVVVTGESDVVAAGAFVVVAGDSDVVAAGVELCSVVEGDSAVRVGAGVVEVALGFAEATGAIEKDDTTSARTARIIPSAAHRDTTSPPPRRRKTRLRMKDTFRSTTRDLSHA